MENKEVDLFAKFWKIVNVIILSILIIICLLIFRNKIAFGAGLGDLFIHIVVFFITFLYSIFIIIFRKKRLVFVFSGIIFAFITIQICLAATIRRGTEYPWNGEIFYIPCLHYIEIQNKEVKKTIPVEMCTGGYNSEITAIWEGKLMKVSDEKFLIPPKLKKYIKYPIDYIKIESYYTKSNKGKKYYFNSDTLQIGKKYLLIGEIEKIENGIPVFRVLIE